MTIRSVFLGLVGATLCASSAVACPWANGTYKGTVPPDITLTVTFNENCTQVRVQETGAAPSTLPLSKSNKGWTAQTSVTSLTFDTKGKRAKARRGGAQRTIKMRKL